MKSIFLTDPSLLKLSPHPFFLLHIHSQPFVFIKWSMHFSLRFKCFLIFSRFTELAPGCWRCGKADGLMVVEMSWEMFAFCAKWCMVYTKSLVCEVWRLGRVYEVIFLNIVKCGKRNNQYWWATVADRPHLVCQHPCPWQEIGNRWSLRSFSNQTMPWHRFLVELDENFPWNYD